MPKRCRPASNADPDEDETEPPHDDCYMAATYWGGKLGIAFFQGQTAQVLCQIAAWLIRLSAPP